MTAPFHPERETSLLDRYADFVIEHNKGIRRLGIATFIAGLPMGIAINLLTDIHPAIASMGVMGLGVIEYSQGIHGLEVASRQQRSYTVE